MLGYHSDNGSCYASSRSVSPDALQRELCALTRDRLAPGRPDGDWRAQIRLVVSRRVRPLPLEEFAYSVTTSGVGRARPFCEGS